MKNENQIFTLYGKYHEKYEHLNLMLGSRHPSNIDRKLYYVNELIININI